MPIHDMVSGDLSVEYNLVYDNSNHYALRICTGRSCLTRRKLVPQDFMQNTPLALKLFRSRFIVAGVMINPGLLCAFRASFQRAFPKYGRKGGRAFTVVGAITGNLTTFRVHRYLSKRLPQHAIAVRFRTIRRGEYL